MRRRGGCARCCARTFPRSTTARRCSHLDAVEHRRAPPSGGSWRRPSSSPHSSRRQRSPRLQQPAARLEAGQRAEVLCSPSRRTAAGRRHKWPGWSGSRWPPLQGGRASAITASNGTTRRRHRSRISSAGRSASSRRSRSLRRDREASPRPCCRKRAPAGLAGALQVSVHPVPLLRTIHHRPDPPTSRLMGECGSMGTDPTPRQDDTSTTVEGEA